MTPLENWRFTNFGTTANSGNAADCADPDGDGLTNAQEFAAGTDPKNAASVLKVTDLAISDGDFVVSFPTVYGKTYRVERSDTLQAARGPPCRTTSPARRNGAGHRYRRRRQPRRFYRIVVP